MITKIDAKTAYRLLKEQNDIFSLKIYSNLKAYEGYDFYTVYAGKGFLIGRYYDDVVIRTKGVISEDEMDELSLFLKVCGFSQALCGLETGKRLQAKGWENLSESPLYRFASGLIPEEELSDIPDRSEIKVNPELDEVFEIVKDGFPDIDRDGWYADMSHKVRHGVAEIYVYGGATVTKIADRCGAALLTLVASGKEARGKGSAKKLLRAVGTSLEKRGTEALIICREELAPFYKKAGFYEAGKTVTIRG